MRAPICIRLVRDTDQAEWLRLQLALWPGDSLAEHVHEINAINAVVERPPVFVAEAPTGGLCGLLEVTIRRTAEGCATDDVGYLEGWFVDAAWRGQEWPSAGGGRRSMGARAGLHRDGVGYKP